MKFKIPFTFSDIDRLKKRSVFFSSKVKHARKSFLNETLKNAGVNITREEYLGICLRSTLIIFIFLFAASSTVLYFMDIGNFYFISLGFAFLFSGFIFSTQQMYPKIYISRKEREIEKNLLPALQNILIQLNSGIPLFNIMANISGAEYGVLSEEFKKAVNRINAGVPESEALKDLGKTNPSIFFRRTLWQISNGMNAGSDISNIIRDSIKALTEEQIIQIQTYGNKLNPLIVLYMLMAVIIPALSVTFLTVISSMVGLAKNMTTSLFIAVFVFDILFQIMFLGLIKSGRPSLV
jgi:pilus assembly protein TadC